VFEAPPVHTLYWVIWDIFYIILPLSGTAVIANYLSIHTIDPAYEATLWISFCSISLDAWIGAYPPYSYVSERNKNNGEWIITPSFKLFYLPTCVLTVLLLYTGLMEWLGDIHLYSSIHWKESFLHSISLALQVYGVLWIWCFVWYILLAAKNEYYGILSYKKGLKEKKSPSSSQGGPGDRKKRLHFNH
jgi:hypothetical protein